MSTLVTASAVTVKVFHGVRKRSGEPSLEGGMVDRQGSMVSSLQEVIEHCVSATQLLYLAGDGARTNLGELAAALLAATDAAVMAYQAEHVLDEDATLAPPHVERPWAPRPIAVLVRHQEAVEEGLGSEGSPISLPVELLGKGLLQVSRRPWLSTHPALFCRANTKTGYGCQRKAAPLSDGLRADHCYQHVDQDERTWLAKHSAVAGRQQDQLPQGPSQD
jgi:hypothetical protein